MFPDSFAPGTTTSAFVMGSGFAPNAVALVSGPGITVSTFSNGCAAVRITVTGAPSAPPGPRTITIVNPGTFGVASGFCGGCLVVPS